MRPAKTLEAANYHVQTSELFQKEHIQVHQNWQENVVTALSDPTATTSSIVPDYNQNIAENIQNTQVSVDRHIVDEIARNFKGKNNTGNSDDEQCEVEERPSGVTDTSLQQPDIC